MKFDTSTVQTRVPSPLGPIAIAATTKGLAGLWFTNKQRFLPAGLLEHRMPVGVRPGCRTGQFHR